MRRAKLIVFPLTLFDKILDTMAMGRVLGWHKFPTTDRDKILIHKYPPKQERTLRASFLITDLKKTT